MLAFQALKQGGAIWSKIYIPTTKPEDWQSLLADPEKQWRKNRIHSTGKIRFYGFAMRTHSGFRGG
jgi:hypothetical protein